MPHLMARARSVLRNSPVLASCMFEGQLAFVGLFLDGLKRYLRELWKKKKHKQMKHSCQR